MITQPKVQDFFYPSIFFLSLLISISIAYASQEELEEVNHAIKGKGYTG